MKRLVFKFLVEIVAPFTLIPVSIRWKILRLSGIKIEASRIKPYCYISSVNTEIGKGTFVNSHTKLFSTENGNGKITIKENCDIGMNVLITTMTHEIGYDNRRASECLYQPVVINDGCWLGANVTVLSGVTIGEGCIIASGAVVIKDCEPNSVYAGVPAKKVKQLNALEKLSVKAV